MNIQHPVAGDLPPLDDERIEVIEQELFAGIARDRAATAARRRRRGTWWVAGGAAAAVIAVAAVIAPNLGGVLGVAGGAGGSAVAPQYDSGAPDGWAADGGAADSSGGGASAESGDESGGDLDGGREMVTTAAARLVVPDVSDAAREIAKAAEARQGYVESMNVDVSVPDTRAGTEPGVITDGDAVYYPYPPEGAWITVRVPSAELSGLTDELSELGEVTSSTVNRQDVSDQARDLRARIDAAQASVDRLTALMKEAGDLSDLIAAETALSDRQAMLESYQSELEWLERQVSMSSLTVTLVPDVEIAEADPAGFGDGLAAGWNGLIATLNGIVIALGFLLPWIVVLGLIGLGAWALVRIVRRRRSRRRAEAG